MSDRLTQLGFYLISRGHISPEHWQLVQHVMVQTLEQSLDQLDLTSPSRFSQDVFKRLRQKFISGWLQTPGHEIDPELAHAFTVQELLKLEFFPCVLQPGQTLVLAVVHFDQPEIKRIVHRVWPQVTLEQIAVTKNQLLALLMGQRLGQLPRTCDQIRKALDDRVFQSIESPFVKALAHSGFIANQIYQDQVDRQLWQQLQPQLTPTQQEDIQRIQDRTGSSLGDILIRLGYLSELNYQNRLNQFAKLPMISMLLGTEFLEVDVNLLKHFDAREMMDSHFFPLAWVGERSLQVVVRNPFNSEVEAIVHRKFPHTEIIKVLGTERDITALLAQYYQKDFSNGAIYQLLQRAPHESAARVFTLPQLLVLYSLAVVGLWLLTHHFWATLASMMLVLNLFFVIAIGFKLVLGVQGLKIRQQEHGPWETLIYKPQALPIYTVLVPVYNEPEVIPILIEALRNLDYPQEKLDVLLLLEEKDIVTLEASRAANPPGFVRFILIPDSQPKTKPKACNYGLAFARGEYLTIYDAEDIPDPDQLLKAVWAFKTGSPNLACVQAALNYFNREENFLTRMFTLEYSYWFDCLLPGLESFQFPIPLGGTSNHFRTDLLRELGGWDPFNVTEDADLGIRASQRGYVVGVINSTTYEEANCQTKNWIRQRSRWIKGYMQTWLVHNRNPWRSIRKLGLKNWLGYQFFIGGTIVAFLSSPFLWLLYFYWLFTRGTWLVHLFPGWTLYISLICLLLGNALGIYLNMTAIFRRRYFRLLPYALLNPIYWQLHSIASYMALWQLFTKPFYWEKTQHGLSKVKKHTV
jgi:cellulose synthase/poly-beta-1,6-N-acetylglucosamine synthase-like glycosyltransferase